jgi:hypothetical protein
MARGEHRRPGRPRGASAKLDQLRALIEQGVDPIEAARRVGYSDPERVIKHHAATLAEAKTQADPIATLKHIAQFGETADKIRACADLLSLVGEPEGPRDQRILTCIDARTLPQLVPGVFVHILPSDTDRALQTWDRMVLGKTDARIACGVDSFSAIQVLSDIVVRGEAKDAELRQAAVALLKKHTGMTSTTAPRTVFLIPSNGRVPVDAWQGAAIFVSATDPTVDPCALFWKAVKARRPKTLVAHSAPAEVTEHMEHQADA